MNKNKNGYVENGYYFHGKKIRRDIPLAKGPSFIKKILDEFVFVKASIKYAGISIIASIIIAVILSLTVFLPDTVSPTLTLLGEYESTLPHYMPLYGEYNEPGIICSDDEDLNCEYEIVHNNVNMDVSGDYEIHYVGIDVFGNRSEVYVRHVRVTDKPLIIGLENNTFINEDVSLRFTFGNGLLTKDGGAPITYNSETAITEEGVYTLNVETIVEGGSNADPITFTIDKTAPVISETLASDFQFYRDAIMHVNYDDSLPDISSSINVLDNFDGVMTYDFSYNDSNPRRASGSDRNDDRYNEYIGTISVTDRAGNTSTLGITYRWYNYAEIREFSHNEFDDNAETAWWVAHRYATVTIERAPLDNITAFVPYTTYDTSNDYFKPPEDGVYRVIIDYSGFWDGHSDHTDYYLDSVDPVVTLVGSPGIVDIAYGQDLSSLFTYFNITDNLDGSIPLIDYDTDDFIITLNSNSYSKNDMSTCYALFDVQYEYQDRADNKGLSSVLQVRVTDGAEVSGVCNNQETNNSYTPVLTGQTTYELKKNGSTFGWTNGQTVTDEGNYVLTYSDGSKNYTMNFTIDKSAPVFSNIIDGHTYNTDVHPTWSDQYTWIDYEKYRKNGGDWKSIDSGDRFRDSGFYEIKVRDAFGHETVISFRIDKNAPSISGVSNGGTYTTERTINFSDISGIASATINYNFTGAVALNDGDKFSAPGNYSITLTDTLGNSRTLNFTIT